MNKTEIVSLSLLLLYLLVYDIVIFLHCVFSSHWKIAKTRKKSTVTINKIIEKIYVSPLSIGQNTHCYRWSMQQKIRQFRSIIRTSTCKWDRFSATYVIMAWQKRRLWSAISILLSLELSFILGSTNIRSITQNVQKNCL